MAARNPSGAAQEKTSPDCRTEEAGSGSDWTVSGLRFSRGLERIGILIRSCHRDAKWIARWFKQVNNSASKSKLQTGTVGRHLSRSQTAPPSQSIDGSNTVKSENLAESTTSGTGTSPSVFSAPLEHAYLFSRSGVQVDPENGRSATGYSAYHTRLHSSGWELEHPAVAPDLQGNRELERPLFYPHSHSANPVALPRPHTDLVDSQLPLGIVTVANSPVYLASQALPPFRHGTSSPNIGPGIDNVKSSNPHTSPSPASAPAGPLQTPTRYLHVNLVSERSGSAYTELELGYPQLDLGPGPGVGVRAGVEAATGTHVNLSHAQAVLDFVAPTGGSQLGPPESSAPLPSMYWLLFDTELDSVIDQERGDVVSRSPSNDRTMEPHVTPTPISFFAKWEDMLALERRIRSSSHNPKLAQSKQIQAGQAVEPNRTRQQSGTGKGGLFRCPLPFSFFFSSCRELMHGQSRPRPLWSRSRSLNG